MAKYERVEFAKEKPEKSGWYFVSWRFVCDYKICRKEYWNGEKLGHCENALGEYAELPKIWFRKLPKTRKTTGMTAIQALKAMKRGECVQIDKTQSVMKCIDEKIRIFRNGSFEIWACGVNYLLSSTFSIVPDPSKPKEPERETFGFEEACRRTIQGRKCVNSQGQGPRLMAVVNNVLHGLHAMPEGWKDTEFYEVTE